MSTPTHATITNIPYTLTNPHPRQILDIYLPLNHHPSTSSPSPLILYIHGGAFKFGSKESPLLPLRQVQTNSYILAALNYRRSGEALFPAMIQDCKSAIRYLKSQDFANKYGVTIDPTRVAVWGESAGGHAAAFLGTTSPSPSSTATNENENANANEPADRETQTETEPTKYDVGDYLDIPCLSSVVAVVDYYGPTDFLSMDEHLPEGYRTHGDADSPESLYLGRKISEVPQLVAEADPCTHVKDLVQRGGGGSGGALPAFFLAHGTQDRVVPEYMSLVLRDELVRYGVDVTYVPVKGADHVFRGIEEGQQRELDEMTDAFLRSVFGR